MKILARVLFVSLAAMFVESIKIELENTHDDIPKTVTIPHQIQSLPIYYLSDEASFDAYLASSHSQKPEKLGSDVVSTPATYLLPPSPESKNEYYIHPTEPGEQSDWYPIEIPQKQTEIVPLVQKEETADLSEARTDLRTGKTLQRGQGFSIPSRNLLPPSKNAPDNFIMLSPSIDLELPSDETHYSPNEQKNIDIPTLRPLEKPHSHHFRVKPESHPVSFITPPKNTPQEYKNPTRLFPKKYINEFKPLPIPISLYVHESADNAPTAKPAQPLKPVQHTDTDFLKLNEKKNYIYGQSHKKRKLKHQKEAEKSPVTHDDDVIPTEQEASESNHRYPGRHTDSTQLRHEPVKHKSDLKSKGERTEFRMHGMNGPHSYQFGYDTGKGKNRQFRYEERDNDGNVKGHYGYVDKFGKLRVVNYNADPEHGFRAEAPVINE